MQKQANRKMIKQTQWTEHKQFIVTNLLHMYLKENEEEHHTYIFLLIYTHLYNRDYRLQITEWVCAICEQIRIIIIINRYSSRKKRVI